jgi:hypothetical protein
MVDVRRALPATPAALCCGAVAMLVPLQRPAAPFITLGVGVLVTALALLGVYDALAAWPEGARRLLGYAAATALGAIAAGVLVFAAIGEGMCGLFGETCTRAELDRVNHLLVAGPIAFAATLVAYATLDLATRSRRGARR